MKNLISLFALIALFTFTTTAVSAQSLEFINKSQCDVTVQLYIFDANCDLVCAGNPVTVLGETEISIPWNCGVLYQPSTSTFAIRVLDGMTGAGVGTGCGLSLIDNYDDCQGINRTLEMYSPASAVIY